MSASVAHIPFILGSFKGFLIGLQTEKDFYGFTSINGSKLEVRQAGRDRAMTVQSSRYRLDIGIRTFEDAFVLCNAPKDGQMMPLVKETLTAAVNIRLTDSRTGRILFEDTGKNAGIEYGGSPMGTFLDKYSN